MIECDSTKEQHMMINPRIINLIVKEAKISKKDKVIEIGAGTGILTKELVKNSKQVLAFEIDEKFKPELDKIKIKNLEIIYGNALKYSWHGHDKIISNIPYSLSEAILMKGIYEDIPFMVLTIGENFKELLESKETKVGILANLFYKITPILRIDKNDFNPPPRVNSWVVKFEKKEQLEIEKLLYGIVKRKGKIKNAILHSLVGHGKTKNQARGIIKMLKIDEYVLDKPTASLTGKFLKILEDRLKNIV